MIQTIATEHDVNARERLFRNAEFYIESIWQYHHLKAITAGIKIMKETLWVPRSCSLYKSEYHQPHILFVSPLWKVKGKRKEQEENWLRKLFCPIGWRQISLVGFLYLLQT